MLRMTEEENQKIEALLKQCRRQTSEIEQYQKDWEERNKAMKAKQERQQKKSQQAQPKPGETSGEGLSTSILKVKSQKGKTVKIVQVEEDKLVEKKSDESRRKDESEKRDEPTEQEETEDESDIPPVEFEDKMYKLMQEMEMMTEHQEEELVSQLTLREKAEYQEMKEYYQLQAREMEQGMELRSAEIKEKARRRAPGLSMDLIQ